MAGATTGSTPTSGAGLPPVGPGELDPEAARRLRRSGALVLGILQVLIIAVAISGTADLRPLASAQGTARAFVEAALGGDCARYLDLLTPAARDQVLAAAPPATVPGLAAGASQRARACAAVAQTDVGVTTVQVLARTGSMAVVEVGTTTGPAQTLDLVKTGGHWRVSAP